MPNSEETQKIVLKIAEDLCVKSKKLEFTTAELIEYIHETDTLHYADRYLRALISNLLVSGAFTKVGEIPGRGTPAIMSVTSLLEDATTPEKSEETVKPPKKAPSKIGAASAPTATVTPITPVLPVPPATNYITKADAPMPRVNIGAIELENKFSSVQGMHGADTLDTYLPALEDQIFAMLGRIGKVDRQLEESIEYQKASFARIESIGEHFVKIEKWVTQNTDPFTGGVKLTVADDKLNTLIKTTGEDIANIREAVDSLAQKHNMLVNEKIDNFKELFDGMKKEILEEGMAQASNAGSEEAFARGYERGRAAGVKEMSDSVIKLKRLLQGAPPSGVSVFEL